ncbi:MAG: winged helix-turn-helix transcriptional regulator [Flavobacteriales bacterium]|nr:winged helix-turn-helix transcriptional regulator [Flavobacteriales bacterium]
MMAHRGLARTGNDGLLDRVVIRPKPLHVEYTLTPLALQLVPLLKGMEGLECGIKGRGGLGRYFDELLNVPPQFGGGRPRVPPYGLFCGT